MATATHIVAAPGGLPSPASSQPATMTPKTALSLTFPSQAYIPPPITNPQNDTPSLHSLSISLAPSLVQQQQQQQQQQRQQPEGPLSPVSARSLPWNASHPCYPHPNPHVPLSSPLLHTTRIIRIPRDWMAAGDLYPAYSSIYPEILSPWVTEASFRSLITSLNTTLRRAFEPGTRQQLASGFVALLSGWVLEDVGLVGGKARARDVEAVIEDWNRERERGRRPGGGGDDDDDDDNDDNDGDEDRLVRVVPLRRTAYTCLDIQIPDPKVRFVGAGDAQEGGGKGSAMTSRPGTGAEDDGARNRRMAAVEGADGIGNERAGYGASGFARDEHTVANKV